MQLIKNRFLKKVLLYKHTPEFFLFLFTLAIYVHNLSPSVYGGDSGDLISAVIKKGVPHPSGYPLYTMLGILFSTLPINATYAWKVGLVSAVSSSTMICVYYLLIKELSSIKFLSFLTSLVLAFTYTVWLYAEIAEVLSLNGLFIILILYFTVLLVKHKNIRYLYWLFFTLGLSLTNNLTILLIFPTVGITILISSYKTLFKIKTILNSILLFILGILPYAYIPISAKTNPAYSWGYAVNFQNFVSLVFRKEYGWGLHTEGFSQSTITQLFQNYLIYWQEYINFLVPFLILFGVFYFVKKGLKLYIFLFLTSYLMVGPFYLLYARLPIQSLVTIAVYEKFYLSSIIIAFIFLPFSFILLFDILDNIKSRKYLKQLLTWCVHLLLITLIFSVFVTNYDKLNFNKSYIGDKFSQDILKDLPKNSIVFLTGDTKVFNSYYIQNAYDFRRDIYIPGRPESFRGLLNYTIMDSNEIEKYITKRGGTLDKETYITILPTLIKNHEVYSDHILPNTIIEFENYGKIVFIPWGLTRKLYFEKTFNLTKDEYIKKMVEITNGFQIDINEESDINSHNLNFADIQMHYASAYFSIADFIAKYYQDPQTAKYFVEKSLYLDPLN